MTPLQYLLLGWLICFLQVLPALLYYRRLSTKYRKLLDSRKVGPFERFALPIIRKTAPALIAESLVSVQPMSTPIALQFYLDLVNKSQLPPEVPLDISSAEVDTKLPPIKNNWTPEAAEDLRKLMPSCEGCGIQEALEHYRTPDGFMLPSGREVVWAWLCVKCFSNYCLKAAKRKPLPEDLRKWQEQTRNHYERLVD